MQAEMRRIQIERANKILFDESDKVKVLHSKMMESDSIKENEKLVMYKRQMDVLRKAQDAAFMEQQRQAMEVGHDVIWLADDGVLPLLCVKGSEYDRQQRFAAVLI